MSRVRVCFLGTPAFAVTCLQGLLDDSHFEVVGVVTQPDRPAGRKMVLTPSPVKLLAQKYSLPILSPESVNKDPIREEVARWGAEVAVVVAFGQIVSQKFLDLFPMGCVNVHGSLVPRWRGAAPIQRALEAGDQESGVALQKMVKELDAGDVLGVRRLVLDLKINALELHDQLAKLSVDLLQVELMDYLRGNLVPTPQDATKVTYAKKLDKSESLLHWSEQAEKLHNKVRSFLLGPGTYTFWAGKKLKIHRTEWIPGSESGAPGQIHSLDETGIVVQTGAGRLRLIEVQPESRQKMSAVDFAKGYSLGVGDRFTEDGTTHG